LFKLAGEYLEKALQTDGSVAEDLIQGALHRKYPKSIKIVLRLALHSPSLRNSIAKSLEVLTHADLSESVNLGDEELIGLSLPDNLNLTTLLLDYCAAITDKSLAIFASSSPKLRVLSLRYKKKKKKKKKKRKERRC
jgi:hypothetical protein